MSSKAASGEVGSETFKLVAAFGGMVFFGAKNIHDTISSEKIQQPIYKHRLDWCADWITTSAGVSGFARNQTLIGFNVPTLRREQIAECVPEPLKLISQGSIKLFANTTFPLAEVRKAFEAVSKRRRSARSS